MLTVMYIHIYMYCQILNILKVYEQAYPRLKLAT
jgi:hypothetical protein